MSRTRLISIAILALCLVIVVISVSMRLMSAGVLAQLFVASTVFAGGVVAMDLFGLLGGHHGDDADGDGDGDGVDAGHVEDGAGHDHDAEMGVAPAGHPHGDVDGHDVGHDVGHVHAGHHRESESNALTVLSVLTFLRTVVYFCLGFGPSGWVALALGWMPLPSLLLAAPVGALSLALSVAFFRFQRKDTGAWTGPRDLLQETATVIIPLDSHTMGKVRVRAGMNVSDLYARAEEPGRVFGKGDMVRIVHVTDECVLVR